ncbi:hypothetical protein AB0O76_06535 [Streptomyces sp. NPDC086554]|uniref:hypothetical protein n=1 Tax=Streptomyces sp. NPDC086554 TaxID=3154864 RepID=UPI0034489BDB
MGGKGRLHVSAELAGVLERIDALGGMLDERADAAEELGRLPEDTARALLDTGIVRAGLPLSLGGYEFALKELDQGHLGADHGDRVGLGLGRLARGEGEPVVVLGAGRHDESRNSA